MLWSANYKPVITWITILQNLNIVYYINIAENTEKHFYRPNFSRVWKLYGFEKANRIVKPVADWKPWGNIGNRMH